MATAKSKSTIPSFPAPTPHKVAAGDVFTRLGSTIIIVALPKGEEIAEGIDVSNGKKKVVKKNVIESKFAKLGTSDAARVAKELRKMLKGSTSASAPAPATDPATPASEKRKKKTPAPNAPAPGPNPALN